MRLSGFPVIFPHAGASRQSRFAAQKMTSYGNAGSAEWFRRRGAESRTSAADGLLYPKCQHVQAEPAPHDPEQQHRLEGERERGGGGRAITAEARYQENAEHDIHREC